MFLYYTPLRCTMAGKLYHNRDWLYEEYITKERTMTDIAKEFEITPMAIQLWLDKHNIPTRPRGNHQGGRPMPRKREETITITVREYNRLIEVENKWRTQNE